MRFNLSFQLSNSRNPQLRKYIPNPVFSCTHVYTYVRSDMFVMPVWLSLSLSVSLGLSLSLLFWTNWRSSPGMRDRVRRSQVSFSKLPLPPIRLKFLLNPSSNSNRRTDKRGSRSGPYSSHNPLTVEGLRDSSFSTHEIGDTSWLPRKKFQDDAIQCVWVDVLSVHWVGTMRYSASSPWSDHSSITTC